MFNNKGLAPVVAVAILLVVATISVVGFQGWYQGFQSEKLSDVDEQSSGSLGDRIDAVTNESVYFHRSGSRNISYSQILVGNVTCMSSGILFPGSNVISLENCTGNITPTNPVGVSVVTEAGVVRKVVNLEQNAASQGLGSENGEDGDGEGEILVYDTFVSVWNTSKWPSPDNRVSLPTMSTGTYNFTVCWGDGTCNNITSWNAGTLHTYESPGVYEVNITGQFEGFYLYPAITDRRDLVEIKQWGPVRLGNGGAQFDGAYYLVISADDYLNISGVTNFSRMFKDVKTISGNFLSYWDVSNVTDMSYMFTNVHNISADITDWDVSNVVDMEYMFGATSPLKASIFNQDISNWDVSNVADMSSMFRSAEFTQNLSSWDVSSVTDMAWMFSFANNFNSDIDDWNVSNVVDMTRMFYNAENFNRDLSSWDVEQVTSCDFFDSGATSWALPKPNFTGC